MYVVGHEDIGMDPAPVSDGGLGKILQVPVMVRASEEARLPVIAALDDVLGHSGQIQAWRSRHQFAPSIWKASTSQPGRAAGSRELPGVQ
jgi:hypothetical protein